MGGRIIYRIIILVLSALFINTTCVYSQWSPEVLLSPLGETRTPFILTDDSTIHIEYEHHAKSGQTECQISKD